MIPNSLDESVRYFTDMGYATKNDLKDITLNKFLSNLHFGIGRWIRNNWGLWEETGGLYNQLSELGFTHPDDMSTLILKYYYATITGTYLDLEAESNHYKTYWENNSKFGVDK